MSAAKPKHDLGQLVEQSVARYNAGKSDGRFECPLCDKSFSLKRNLTSHLRRHLFQPTFECEVCGKKFKRRSELRAHAVVHTQEKPFECKVCHRRFARQSDLRSHERTHQGLKPFVCPVKGCGACFSRAFDCKRHMALKHKCDVTVEHLSPMRKKPRREATEPPSSAKHEGAAFARGQRPGAKPVIHETVDGRHLDFISKEGVLECSARGQCHANHQLDCAAANKAHERHHWEKGEGTCAVQCGHSVHTGNALPEVGTSLLSDSKRTTSLDCKLPDCDHREVWHGNHVDVLCGGELFHMLDDGTFESHGKLEFFGEDEMTLFLDSVDFLSNPGPEERAASDGDVQSEKQ